MGNVNHGNVNVGKLHGLWAVKWRWCRMFGRRALLLGWQPGFPALGRRMPAGAAEAKRHWIQLCAHISPIQLGCYQSCCLLPKNCSQNFFLCLISLGHVQFLLRSHRGIRRVEHLCCTGLVRRMDESVPNEVYFVNSCWESLWLTAWNCILFMWAVLASPQRC